MNVQQMLDGKWEVNVLGKHGYDGVEAKTHTLDTFETYENAMEFVRTLELIGRFG